MTLVDLLVKMACDLEVLNSLWTYSKVKASFQISVHNNM